MTKPPISGLPAPLPQDDEFAGGISVAGRDAKGAAETARYIAEFTAELSYLARRERLDLLAYLLDMARLEAARAIQADARKR
ncbi:hypothetical protein [Microvirga sp. TS319]|uniref:hypothetical protein n=1 Tax=Microvirga sp. TS319 TaxID=3241165 RepID=UPI00351A400D